jgi:hypothetical protein
MKRFEVIYPIIFILIVFLMFSVVMYFVMVGSCMERGKQNFGLRYDDTTKICLKQMGAFR